MVLMHKPSYSKTEKIVPKTIIAVLKYYFFDYFLVTVKDKGFLKLYFKTTASYSVKDVQKNFLKT